jgi:hypothetical protein
MSARLFDGYHVGGSQGGGDLPFLWLFADLSTSESPVQEIKF